MTIMTTGAKGLFDTPYGTIEFTDTRRTPADILHNTAERDPRLRIASLPMVLRDLRRVDCNLHMVDMGEYHLIPEEQQEEEES